MQNQDTPKTALVTGGNRGIGKAIAAALVKQGLHVLLACRNQECGIRAARDMDGHVTVVHLDLSDAKRLEKQIAAITAAHPVVDVLVNNAAVLEERGLTALPAADLMYSMQVNAMSAYALIQHFGNRMAERSYGRIVNISSGWGAFTDGLNGPAAYSISKATLNAITKVAAQAYPHSVKINAMCPGWVRTRMGGDAATRSPEDAATTAVWLATLDAEGPTGAFFRDQRRIAW